MVFDLELSLDLAAKLEVAAQKSNLSAEEWIVLATAEKLARMEHEQWLGKGDGAGPDSGQNGPAQDKKP